MKKLLYLLCFLPFIGYGQTYCPIVKFGDTATLDSFIATIKARQLILPSAFKTNCHNATNSIALVGGAIWTYNGSIWVQQTGGGFDSTYIYAALADTAARLNERIDSVAALAAPFDTTHIYAALADSVALRELLSNKVTSFASPNSTTYPTTSAVNGLLSSYVTKVFLYDTIKTKQDTGVVMPIRLGGTGATTAQAALNALAVPTGNSGKILGSNGENVIYTTFPTSVGRVYSPDSSITISPISGSDTLVALSLNLARRNTWTVPQVFTNIDADTVRGKVSLADVYPTPVTNVDSGVYSTKAYRLKGDDSVAKLGIDSAGVLRTLANSKLSLSDTNIIATKLLLQKKVDSLNIVSATKLSLSDTGTIATRARVQKAVDSLNALIALKQNILTAGRFITLTSNIVSVSASGTPSSTTFLRGDSTWAVPSGGSGSVTSVAATVPTDFSISGSPITSTGTLAITHKGLNTITDGANFVFDGSNGNFQKITLGASRTFTITNLLVGVIYKFYVVQDGTGTRILTWGTTVKAGWGYTTTPPISTAANTTDIYEMTTDGTNIFVDVQLGH